VPKNKESLGTGALSSNYKIRLELSEGSVKC